VHPNPEEAKPDGAQFLTFVNFESLMAQVSGIRAKRAAMRRSRVACAQNEPPELVSAESSTQPGRS